jgi:hypothetical protein
MRGKLLAAGWVGLVASVWLAIGADIVRAAGTSPTPAEVPAVANSAQLDARLNGAWLEMQGSIQARLGAYQQEIAGLQKDVLAAAKERDGAKEEAVRLRAQVKWLSGELAPKVAAPPVKPPQSVPGKR